MEIVDVEQVTPAYQCSSKRRRFDSMKAADSVGAFEQSRLWFALGGAE
jgi:hypothetical protein